VPVCHPGIALPRDAGVNCRSTTNRATAAKLMREAARAAAYVLFTLPLREIAEEVNRTR
jgi:hypothetical protein